jgi:hypothetical protein
MSNQGRFSEEAFEKYQRLLTEQGNLEFSEGETYDFTTCIRPDGSAYGTRGKCRKGTEGEARVAPVPPKSAMTSKDPVASALKGQKQLADLHKAENSRVADLVRAGKVKGVDPGAIERIQKRKLQDASSKGDPKAIKKLEEMEKAGAKDTPDRPKRKLATSQETKAAWKEAEKAVKAAKGELALVKAAVGRDKSPESKRRLLNAGAALDKAERAAVKASDKFFAASKRESAKAMTPEQRKLEREADKLTKDSVGGGLLQNLKNRVKNSQLGQKVTKEAEASRQRREQADKLAKSQEALKKLSDRASGRG